MYVFECTHLCFTAHAVKVSGVLGTFQIVPLEIGLFLNLGSWFVCLFFVSVWFFWLS